jgi:hypothetical protein
MSDYNNSPQTREQIIDAREKEAAQNEIDKAQTLEEIETARKQARGYAQLIIIAFLVYSTLSTVEYFAGKYFTEKGSFLSWGITAINILVGFLIVYSAYKVLLASKTLYDIGRPLIEHVFNTGAKLIESHYRGQLWDFDHPSTYTIPSGKDTNYQEFLEITAKQKKRRGGPIPTPEEDIRRIIDKWLKVKGTMPQEVFCKNNSISVSTLTKWMREREISS